TGILKSSRKRRTAGERGIQGGIEGMQPGPGRRDRLVERWRRIAAHGRRGRAVNGREPDLRRRVREGSPGTYSSPGAVTAPERRARGASAAVHLSGGDVARQIAKGRLHEGCRKAAGLHQVLVGRG